jgi:hypothetical protein
MVLAARIADEAVRLVRFVRLTPTRRARAEEDAFPLHLLRRFDWTVCGGGVLSQLGRPVACGCRRYRGTFILYDIGCDLHGMRGPVEPDDDDGWAGGRLMAAIHLLLRGVFLLGASAIVMLSVLDAWASGAPVLALAALVAFPITFFIYPWIGGLEILWAISMVAFWGWNASAAAARRR